MLLGDTVQPTADPLQVKDIPGTVEWGWRFTGSDALPSFPS